MHHWLPTSTLQQTLGHMEALMEDWLEAVDPDYDRW